MLVASSTQSLAVHAYFFRVFRTAFRIRAALICAVYDKAFVLSNASRQVSTVGEIVTHQSVDASKMLQLIPYLHLLWSSPFQLIVGVVLGIIVLGESFGAMVAAGLACAIIGVALINMPVRERSGFTSAGR